MSTFNLVIKNLPEKLSEMKDQPQNGSSKSTDMILDNEKTTSTYSFKIDGKDEVYLFSLLGIHMVKQMYQPVEIVADISIAMAATNTPWAPIPRADLDRLFKHRQITLASKDSKSNVEIGNDFYVHEMVPEYKSSGIIMKLKIYSLDKLLTLKKTSRAFVGKRLGDILSAEMKKYTFPYASEEQLKNSSKASEEDNKKSVNPESTTANMRVLRFIGKKNNSLEHMFPYLVQYNESFYDMLARTTNRWGEFMFYQDGKLQIGYDNSAAPKTVNPTDYSRITYPNKDQSDKLIEHATDGTYDLQAVYDKTVSNTPVPHSPYIVKGELGKFADFEDKYALKKVAKFLNNDKDLNTFIFGNLVDDSASVIKSIEVFDNKNEKINETYFSKIDDAELAEQYDREYNFKIYTDTYEKKPGFNPFTEINAANYSDSKYGEILAAEQKASNNMVEIDYDTYYPDLKLGDIIDVNGEQFIVANISVKVVEEEEFTLKKTDQTDQTDQKDQKIERNIKRKQAIQVTGIGRESEEGLFYPAVIPTGHVRYSGPQKATIVDTSDPTLKHRVRVMFTWQLKEDSDLPDKDMIKKEATPWLLFTAKGDGASTTGRHQKGATVLVGFIDGNIERPYVIGAIQKKAPHDGTIDTDLNTPNGHFMRLTDGSAKRGLSKFISGALSPAISSYSSFLPLTDTKLGDSNRLEGGFSIGDYYGIYNISGSTDKRNISISSPWGDVNINAFTGITISAPNGDVRIKGKNVSIEAGNNLKLVSGTYAEYKILQDKKYKDYSAATVLYTLSATVAKKLLDKFHMLDMSFVRCVVESVMRPVEGALTVKSNRFLKLEAGKNSCEYPKFAFNVEKKQKMIDAAAKKSLTKLAKNTNLSDSVGQLFEQGISAIINQMNSYNDIYNECRQRMGLFNFAILTFKEYSNNNEKNPCKTYDDLKSVFWSTNVNDQISLDTLGFTGDVGIDSEDDVTEEAFARIKNKMLGNPSKEDVIETRKLHRLNVYEKAQSLREEILKLINFGVSALSVKTALQTIPESLPKGAEAKMCNAISRERNQSLFIYNPSDDIKDFKSGRQAFTDEEKKMLRRAFALNLLDEFGLIDIRVPDPNTPLPPRPKITVLHDNVEGNIMHDDTWLDFINSLNRITLIDTDKTDKSKFLDDLAGLPNNLLGDLYVFSSIPRAKNMFDEQLCWGEAKKGSILIGTNGQTYMIGEGDNPNFKRIEKLSASLADGAENGFLDRLKNRLTSL